MYMEYYSSSSDDAYVFVGDADKISELSQAHIKLNGNSVLVLTDSGATANCVSETCLNLSRAEPRSTKNYPSKFKVLGSVGGAFKYSIEKNIKRKCPHSK